MIVVAHFEESLDYYQRLEIAELEGDLLKAIANNKSEKIRSIYDRLAKAKLALNKSEINSLKI